MVAFSFEKKVLLTLDCRRIVATNILHAHGNSRNGARKAKIEVQDLQ